MLGIGRRLPCSHVTDTASFLYYYFLVPHIMGTHRTDSSSTVLDVNIHNQMTNYIN